MSDLHDIRLQRRYRNNASLHATGTNRQGIDGAQATHQLRRQSKDLVGSAERAIRRVEAASARPPVRQAVRQEHNKNIGLREREKKGLVLSLREVERGGNQSYAALQRSHAQLQACLKDEVQRAVWVAERTKAMRSNLPNDVSDVSQQLQSELASARRWEKHLQRLVKDTQARLKALKSSRAALAAEIHRETRSLGLTGEAFSGAALRYPRPAYTPPESVQAVQNDMRQADIQTAANADAMQGARRDLEAQRNAVDRSIQQSITTARDFQVRSATTRGRVRIAENATSRRLDKTTVARDVNNGPREGRFATVSELPTRPMVRYHSMARDNQARSLVRSEMSRQPTNQYDQQLRKLGRETRRLDRQSRQLEQCATDWEHVATIDDRVLKFRRRCRPGQRLNLDIDNDKIRPDKF